MLQLTYNGWVYEQVCLVECFKLPIPLVANLLIYRVRHRFLLINNSKYEKNTHKQ